MLYQAAERTVRDTVASLLSLTLQTEGTPQQQQTQTETHDASDCEVDSSSASATAATATAEQFLGAPTTGGVPTLCELLRYCVRVIRQAAEHNAAEALGASKIEAGSSSASSTALGARASLPRSGSSSSSLHHLRSISMQQQQQSALHQYASSSELSLDSDLLHLQFALKTVLLIITLGARSGAVQRLVIR